MATITQGNELMVFVSGTSIACATNHTLAIETETSDTSHKDIQGNWKSSDIKNFSWSVTSENLFTLDGSGQTYSDLVSLMTSKTEVELKFGFASGSITASGYTPSLTPLHSGKAIITSLNLNAPNGDNATYTVTFTGRGVLS